MTPDFSAFDRYKTCTDLEQLCAYSAKPLRKCKRVNTLKIPVNEFLTYAQKANWMTEPVPWCPEGFYIDREDRSVALGKDMLHLIGATYMQEAASMLPPMLLDPQPGEYVLDMSAAPGSKSTQMAAMMENKGVLVCNDMQELRLRTLMTALNRCGVINVLVTKKVGQWFGKHMTEHFDRVLIDAPCTAQGTVRKDSEALNYTSEHGIRKAARLQHDLLEAAVHATKVGGRIVYSTCTLTPEENEQTVADILRRYEGMLEIVDPRTVRDWGSWDIGRGIEDSHIVQKEWTQTDFPMVRLWPQTYDSEGFFCAVLRKTARTREPGRYDPVALKLEEMPKSRVRDVRMYLEERYGKEMLAEDEVLLQNKERLWVTTAQVLGCRVPAPLYGIGLPFGRTVNDAPVFIDHDVATLRGSGAAAHAVDIRDEDLAKLMSGMDCPCDPALTGPVLLRHQGRCIGRAKAKDGNCKNHLPRWMIQVGG